jgi:hypothetical protein
MVLVRLLSNNPTLPYREKKRKIIIILLIVQKSMILFVTHFDAFVLIKNIVGEKLS